MVNVNPWTEFKVLLSQASRYVVMVTDEREREREGGMVAVAASALDWFVAHV